MSTNTYFWHFVMHNIAKHVICDIDYRLHVSLCMRVLKKDNKKEHNEIKNWDITRKN